jgi:hypothetical protein
MVDSSSRAYNSAPSRIGQREGVAVTETIATTEQLLAEWREAQRALEALDPYTPGRADVEARVEHAKAAYRARVASIDVEPNSTLADWRTLPEIAEAG